MASLFGNQLTLFSALCHWFPFLISTAGFSPSTQPPARCSRHRDKVGQDIRGDAGDPGEANHGETGRQTAVLPETEN